LFLSKGDFDLEDDNAFYIEGAGGDGAIWRRERGRESVLRIRSGSLSFEDAAVWLRLTPEMGIQEMSLRATFEGTFSLKSVSEMAIIFHGITTSAPYLLAGRS
jgi:hypothetical protein